MRFELKNPVCLTGGNAFFRPNTDEEISERPYVLGTDEELTACMENEAVEMTAGGKAFAEAEFGKLLDRISESRNVTAKDDLAFVYFGKAGALVATMGKCRVVQMRPTTGDVVYDSANQIVDIYSSKAAVELQTDVVAGDIFVLCSTGKFDCRNLAKCVASMASWDATTKFLDSKGNEIGLMTVEVAQVTGRALKVKDLTALWYAVAAILVVCIIGFGLATFITSKADAPAVADEQDTVTVATDSLIEPAVAVSPEPEATDTTQVKADTLNHYFHNEKEQNSDEEKSDVDTEEKTEHETPNDVPTQSPTEPTGEPEI